MLLELCMVVDNEKGMIKVTVLQIADMADNHWHRIKAKVRKHRWLILSSK